MKLITANVKKFRNIIDSNSVKIDDSITCLVGKNESGKSSFLHALYRLNPARKNVKFIIEDHYPAWLEKKDRLRGIELTEQVPITANFELNEQELKIISEYFEGDFLKSKILSLSRNYDGDLFYELEVDEQQYLKYVLQGLSFSQDTRSAISNCHNVEKLQEYLNNYSPPVEPHEKEATSIATLKAALKDKIGGAESLIDAIYKLIEKYIPQFIYFDKYSSLPHSVKIKEVLQTPDENLDDNLLTAKTLLRMAAADDDYLLNPNYERRKRELENVANALTEDVLNYWSQNPKLRVNPDITQKTEAKTNGQHAVVDELKIRIWDDKHLLSLPFNEHSTGFQWFFSFLAAFSEFEFNEQPVIILLDEPGLGLHGKAQADFLKFIEERLSPKRQVIYTTHSPFLVQPNKLERARIVEEKSREEGAKVSQEILTTDSDTLFPLQAALGYDLTQHLFISKNNLVVEGTSDFTYITILSDYLRSKQREGLLEAWTVVPVGGADLIPTFVALLGIHLDITVLIDSRSEGNQKLTNLADKGYLNAKRIITINEFTPNKLADIEDLFDPNDYIKIYNDSFNDSINLSELKGTDQIVSKIARLKGISRFDHGKPADNFLRKRDIYLDQLSELTLTSFEKLFNRINKTFKD
jgi:predicted ATP-dependent endonuclease of OLD family